jgi:hypothetical protein
MPLDMGSEVFTFHDINSSDAEIQSVTEDLVRYMKAGHNHGEFFMQDPQWAMDFAPNGKLGNTTCQVRSDNH